jgi:hypothetical protein
MKKSFILLFSILAFAKINAQVVDLKITPDTLVENKPSSVDAIPINIEVKNTAGKVRTIVWERIVITITDDWSTQVCDPITCWAPAKSTSEFDLASNGVGAMVIDAFTEQKRGSAYIKMKFSDKADPNTAIIGRYRFNAVLVGTEEIEATKLRLFPNPTADYFVLEGNAPLTEVQVLSMDGRVLKTFPYIENDIYEIQDLNPGAYMLSLNGENDKRLATKRLMKL